MNKTTNFLCLSLLLIGSASFAMDADLGGKELCGAARKGNLELVKRLLDEGTSVNARDLLGLTPLTYAAINCHVEICQSLLDHNAQIDAIDVHRKTALIWAANDGTVNPDQIPICHFLINTTLNQCIQPGSMVALLGMKKFHRAPLFKSIEREIIKQIAKQACALSPKIKTLFLQIDAIENKGLLDSLRTYAQEQLKMNPNTNQGNSHE